MRKEVQELVTMGPLPAKPGFHGGLLQPGLA